VLWIVAPGFGGFAAGFALWAIGGALASGALEALLYDGLAAVAAEEHYAAVHGRVSAMGLICQLPAAAAATVLLGAGGYHLVGWVSVGCCVAAAGVGGHLPEVRSAATPDDAGDVDVDGDGDVGTGPGWLAVLRAGMVEAARRPGVRAAVVAVAVLSGFDGLEEYFPLLARQWGVATRAVPLAMVAVPLAGAAGAALGGVVGQLRPRTLGALVGGAATVFAGAALVHRPAGVAGIALAYGTYRAVLVVTDARLQRRIEGPARATVTSVAAFGTEVSAMAVIAVWSLGRPAVVVVLAMAVATALPWLLRPHGRGSAGASSLPNW
jgi:hypothetical protein